MSLSVSKGILCGVYFPISFFFYEYCHIHQVCRCLRMGINSVAIHSEVIASTITVLLYVMKIFDVIVQETVKTQLHRTLRYSCS